LSPVSNLANIGPALRFLGAGPIVVLALILCLLPLTGCTEPPLPAEVDLAISQDQDLWKVGVPKHAAHEYGEYSAALEAAQALLIAERSRFIWFRDYDPVAKAFRAVIEQGEHARTAAKSSKSRETAELTQQINKVAERVRILRNLASDVRDRKLSTRSLSRAEILINESRGHVRNGEWAKARRTINEASLNLDGMVKATRELVSRFADTQQISHWRALVAGSISRSRASGGYLIVVNKLDRELSLYKAGQLVKSYPAGMGFNYLNDKLYSGDNATPEGEYKVIRKLPASQFYKALLINYPNEDDQRRFALAKKRGEISKKAQIGGLIEIHGGGTEGLTRGCVALDNRHMLELFNAVEVGTPVVIVGALSTNNALCSTLESLCNEY
jgi:hypothetical protein